MIVVLIIGILVAIAIPAYGSVATAARKAACQGNLRTVDGAVAQWEVSALGNDPVAKWGGVGVDRGLGSSGTLIADLSPAFVDLDKSARCPVNNAQYNVTITASGVGGPGVATFVCPNGHTY